MPPHPGHSPGLTHYQRLGVDHDAPPAAIRRAFRALARQLHPDVNRAPDAAAEFTQVQQAYEVVSDPVKRREYDRLLRQSTALPGNGSGQAHYTWSNIAEAGASVAEPGPDEIEDLWQTFFARRAGEATESAPSRPRKRPAPKGRAKR